MPYFFLNSGFHPAAYNMALDEHLLNLVKGQPDLNFFRVYGWDPPAFSIGYSQRVNQELDLDLCRAAGYQAVRRPTGGRTVLHKNEMAYTYVTRTGSGRTKPDQALLIGRLFINVFQLLKVPARLVETGAPPKFTRHAPSLCFTNLSQHEVMAAGRKLIGRATREKGDSRLEQGFILLTNDYLELVDFLPDHHRSHKEKWLEQIKAKTCSLKEAGAAQVTFSQLSGLLHQEAERLFECSWQAWQLGPEDEKEIQRLVAEKYGNDAWLFRL